MIHIKHKAKGKVAEIDADTVKDIVNSGNLDGLIGTSLIGTGLIGTSLIGTGLIGTSLIGTGLITTERVPVNLYGDTKEQATLTGWQAGYQAYLQASDACQRGEKVNIYDYIWSSKN